MLLHDGMLTTTGTYDEALQRFHTTGPEFDGYLSNHGPMVVEVLARRGQDALIHAWTDDYVRRLDDLPRGTRPIQAARYREAFGDVSRTADWIDLMIREVADDPWPLVLSRWWPRLLPGIAAGATHGVIRVGHAVRALQAAPSPPRVAELAHALGYWAARWQPVPVIRPTGSTSALELVRSLPTVAYQENGIRERLVQLDGTAGWAGQVAQLGVPPTVQDVPAAINGIVDAVVAVYPLHAQGNPTMLVHAATAPNAVAMALPSLPMAMWRDSFDASWSAAAAVVAAYRAPSSDHHLTGARDPDDAMAQALRHRGEHVIKLTDAALSSFERTGDPLALAAVTTAVALDA